MGLTLKVPYYAKYTGHWYLTRHSRIDLEIMQIEIANRTRAMMETRQLPGNIAQKMFLHLHEADFKY